MRLCKISPKTKQELYRLSTEKKNRAMERFFLSVPYNERIILVPHCLRNTKKCKAKESGAYFICLECGSCKIGAISKKSKEFGYKGIYVLKGGKAIEKLVEETKPKAVLAIACYFEGAQGFELIEGRKSEIAVQFVPLSKDGCVDTDVDLKNVSAIIENPEAPQKT